MPHQLEPLVEFAQQAGGGHPAILENQLALVIAPVRDALGPAPPGEAGRIEIDKEAADRLLAALLARRGAEDHEIGHIGVADEMLGAVDYEIPTLFWAIPARESAHGADIGPGIGLGHREAVVPFAADRRQQILLDLAALAPAQDIAWAGDHHLQAIAGAAEFALHQRGVEGAKASAAQLGRHIHRIKPERPRLGADLRSQLVWHAVGLLDHFLMRIELGLDKAAHGFDQHLLFGRQFEMHHAGFRLMAMLRPAWAGRGRSEWAASTACTRA